MNHWFYILTEGKAGTNDKGTTYNVSGIGITKAARIAYRAESVYLFPNAHYVEARVTTIQAAGFYIYCLPINMNDSIRTRLRIGPDSAGKRTVY